MSSSDPNPAPGGAKVGAIGDAPLRREDARLVSGLGQFTDDVAIDDALYVTFARSTVAWGKIRRISVEAAEAVPGVVAVFSGEDVAGLGDLFIAPMLELTSPPPYPVLAHSHVSAVGQPVAGIITTSRNAGLNAAELIEIEIDEEDAVLFEDASSKSKALSQTYEAGDVGKAFSKAAHIVEVSVQHPRLAPSSLEPRSVAVKYDASSELLTVWLSTQTPHRARTEVAKIIGIPSENLRVIAPDVGGAFGLKASVYPEEVFTVWAAHQLKRSIRWSATRGEEFLSATHGRGAQMWAQLAIDGSGRFLGLKAEICCPLGNWLPTSAAIPAWNAARILPGPYSVASILIKTAGAVTTTAPVGIYRGAGRPEAAALMERLVDAAAAQTGLDKIEIRKRNLIQSSAMPYTGPTGITFDSGAYEEALQSLVASDAHQELRRRKEEIVRGGKLAGVGHAFFVEPSGRGWESARIDLHADGKVIAATGSSAQGQGRETAYAQIIVDVLGIRPDQITVLSGDTQTCPEGIGALASRSTPIGGSAMLKAVKELKAKAEKNTEKIFPLTAECRYETAGEAWGYGCYAALVAIDQDTGAFTVEAMVCLDDTGNVINTMLVEGQLTGAIAQGLGEAVMEHVEYDEFGQLLTGSFMDYALPRSADMPSVSFLSQNTPSPLNELGAKGVGEAGTIGAPAAILNAAHDAVRHIGVRELTLPLTSEKLWRAINSAKNEIEPDEI